jgi:hypothetical protein
METSNDVSTMFLERSSDGVHFTEITEITSASEQAAGSYSDIKFAPGDNYYRLAVHNLDGSIQYSKLVVLTRTELFVIHVYPNPVNTQHLNIEILSQKPGNYYLSLHDAFGRTLVAKRIVVTTNDHIERLPMSSIAQGVYHLSVFSEDKQKVQATTIVVTK